MAFNVNIPGPMRLDTSTLSQNILGIGESIAQARRNTEIRDIFANLRSDDPDSIDEAERRLMQVDPAMGLKFKESRQLAADRASSRALQERGLGLQERGVVVRESELGRGLAADKEAREAGERFRKEEEALAEQERQDRLRRRSTTKPSSEDEPTVYTPGSEAVGSRWWEEPAKPATPGPQSGLGGVSPLAVVGAMEPSPRELDILPDTPLGPSRGGPQFAQAAGATRTDAGGGAPRAGGLREPQLQEASEEELNLEAQSNRLHRLARDPSLNAQQAANYRAAAATIEKRQKALEDQRNKVYNRRLQTFEQAQGRAESVDLEVKKKLAGETEAKAKTLSQEDSTLSQLEATLKDPAYSSGWVGDVQEKLARRITPVQELVRRGGIELPGQEALRDLVQDPAGLRRNADALMKQSIILQAGPKGLASQTFTDRDRAYTEQAFTTTGDPREVSLTRVRTARAIVERKKKELEIENKGLKQGRTTAEITDAIMTFNRENPLFVNEDGSLTKLGREANPALARGEERRKGASQQQAPIAAPQPGEVKEHKGKRWQFIGGDPSNPRSWREAS